MLNIRGMSTAETPLYAWDCVSVPLEWGTTKGFGDEFADGRDVAGVFAACQYVELPWSKLLCGLLDSGVFKSESGAGRVPLTRNKPFDGPPNRLITSTPRNVDGKPLLFPFRAYFTLRNSVNQNWLPQAWIGRLSQTHI